MGAMPSKYMLHGLVHSAKSISACKRHARKLLPFPASIIIASISLVLVSCSTNSTAPIKPKATYFHNSSASHSHATPPSYMRTGRRMPLGGGVRKIGKPYKIAGRWYTPRYQPYYDKTGIASWYGTQFHRKKTSNGEIFDMNNLTAAHPTLPLPSYIRVTNLSNRRSLVLRVNDRGPYARNRIMDLSRKSAELLGAKNKGTFRVRVQYLGQAPLNGDQSRERSYLARQPWYKARYARRNKQSSWFSRFSLGATTK